MKRLESVAVGGPLDGVKLDGDAFWDGRVSDEAPGRYRWRGEAWTWEDAPPAPGRWTGTEHRRGNPGIAKPGGRDGAGVHYGRTP